MDITSLSAQLGKFSDMNSTLPPLSQWNPKLSGDIDIKITKDGNWWHEGDEITRDKLKRLFSTILKQEDGSYYLITPVEKWRIQVEDLPFVVVLCELIDGPEGLHVSLLTSMGDEITLSATKCIELDSGGVPRVEVRNGLYARLNRNVYYQLAEFVVEESERFILIANGGRHVIG